MAEVLWKLDADDQAMLKAFRRITEASEKADAAVQKGARNAKKGAEESKKAVDGLGSSVEDVAKGFGGWIASTLSIAAVTQTAVHEMKASYAELEKSVDRLIAKNEALRQSSYGGLTASGSPLPTEIRKGIKGMTGTGPIGEKEMTDLMAQMMKTNPELREGVLKYGGILQKAQGTVDLPSFAQGMAQLADILPGMSPEDIADTTLTIGGNIGGFDKLQGFLGKAKALQQSGVSGEKAIDFAMRMAAADQEGRALNAILGVMEPTKNVIDEEASRAATMRSGHAQTIYKQTDKLGGLTGDARLEAILANPEAVLDYQSAQKVKAGLTEGLPEGPFSAERMQQEDILGGRTKAYQEDPAFELERRLANERTAREHALSSSESAAGVRRLQREMYITDMVKRGFAEDSAAVKAGLAAMDAEMALGAGATNPYLADAAGNPGGEKSSTPFAGPGGGGSIFQAQYDAMRGNTKALEENTEMIKKLASGGDKKPVQYVAPK